MAGYPGFAVILERLIGRREIGIDEISEQVEILEGELSATLRETAPTPAFLRRLAPVLGLHTADLFAMAAVPVPDELAVLDVRASRHVLDVVWAAVQLSSSRRGDLRRRVAALPQQDRVQLAPPPQSFEKYPSGTGAVLMQMLANRNLNRSNTARVFALLTPMYLSATVYASIGHGRKELTIDLLANFATVLGVDIGDLAAVGGVEPLDAELGEPSPDQNAMDVAELIWDLRRLTVDQVREIEREAKSLMEHD